MRAVAAIFGASVLAAACTGGNDEVASQPLVSTIPVTAAPVDDFSETSIVEETGYTDGPLADVCPPVIAIQTAGFPGVAVGPLFRLLGETGTTQDLGATTSGPLTRVDGTVEDVTLELRAGGPAVGFSTPLTLMAQDSSIVLAQVSTATAALGVEQLATTGVVTLTQATHQAIIWDPETYPSVNNLNDLRDEEVEVRHVTDSALISFLVEAGGLDADQTIPGFNGEPATFVGAAGALAQLGDLLVDPAVFEALPQWGRPVATLSPVPAGWVGHDDMLVVRNADLEALSGCMGRLVPVIQRAVVSYANDPAATNELMSSLRAEANPLTRLTPELMNQGARDGVQAEVFANGANGVVGDFDIAQIDEFVAAVVEPAGIDPAVFDAIVTNEFIDDTVGF